MRDNLRRYRAIRNALTQAYPTAPTGNFARHLQTLAALISGIVASKSTQLPTLATKVPDGTKPESRVKRFARWIDNEDPRAHLRRNLRFRPPENSWRLYEPDFDFLDEFFGRFLTPNSLLSV